MYRGEGGRKQRSKINRKSYKSYILQIYTIIIDIPAKSATNNGVIKQRHKVQMFSLIQFKRAYTDLEF